MKIILHYGNIGYNKKFPWVETFEDEDDVRRFFARMGDKRLKYDVTLFRPMSDAEQAEIIGEK